MNFKHIHRDNGIFASKAFIDHCTISPQVHTFCGVGQHQQNGSAKHYVGVLTGKPCTMLLHSMRYWRNVVTSEFGSFSFTYTKTDYNSTLQRRQPSYPSEQFTNESPAHHQDD